MSHVDPDVKVGSNVGGGASGGGPREKVLRNRAEINAAARTEKLTIKEKEFGKPKGGIEGSFLAKVDRNNDDELIKRATVGKEVGQAISDQRQKMVPKMTQKDLALKCNISVAELSAFERGTARPDQAQLGRLEKSLGIKLRGTGIGGPLNPPKAKGNPPKKK